ncbi:nucleoporin NSP1-like [Daphnia magna]|uniref:nucleoporin NSP1-like n=1 Tax=Daphnia magna TaxID=35525 RepID=UPI001E1BDA17|nr:nucleoporin NSP1-like [Daphnia magna]
MSYLAFGAPATTTPALGSTFGQSATGGFSFGQTTTAQPPATGGLFGATKPGLSFGTGSTFGAPTTSAAATPAFGQPATSTFGFGTSAGTTPAFGLGAQVPTAAPAPAFGTASTATTGLVLVRVLQLLHLELHSSQLPFILIQHTANIHFSSITIFIGLINSSRVVFWASVGSTSLWTGIVSSASLWTGSNSASFWTSSNPAILWTGNSSASLWTNISSATFGQSTPASQSGLSFGQTSTPASTGLSFGQPAAVQPVGGGLSFGQTTTPASTGLSFGQPTTTSSTGGFGSGVSPLQHLRLEPATTGATGGFSFGPPAPLLWQHRQLEPLALPAPTAATTSAPPAYSFTTPASTTGLSFGTPVTSAATPAAGGFSLGTASVLPTLGQQSGTTLLWTATATASALPSLVPQQPPVLLNLHFLSAQQRLHPHLETQQTATSSAVQPAQHSVSDQPQPRQQAFHLELQQRPLMQQK